MPYPSQPRDRDRWVLDHRPAIRESLDPRRPAGWFVEEESSIGGGSASVLTVLLTNRECPWRCVFCDLWRHTLTGSASVSADDLVAQLQLAFGDPDVRAAAPGELKLYNAGSYFDAGAIPPAADPPIASLARSFRRLIVESHPSLVGDRCWRLRDRLAAPFAGSDLPPTELEVAMGLETVNPAVLEALNKRVTLESFDRAAEALRRERVAFRAFVLVQPPFEAPGEAVEWAVRSATHAWAIGARRVSLIPVREGNGALEALRREGRFRPPDLATLEEALERVLLEKSRVGGGLVEADTWDLERFSKCPACFSGRRARLHRMNLEQRVIDGTPCPACGWGAR
ncbi:MAG: radical SAM protein [Limisphaerales bacterium]